MAGERTQLGEAVIKVSVDSSDVAGGVSSAVKTAETTAQSAPLTAINQQVEVGTVQAFKKATGAVTSFIGKITAVGATVSIFYNLGKAITDGVVEALKSGTERAQEFRDALDLRATVASAEALQKKIDELNATGKTKDREQAQELQQTLISVQGTVNAKALRAREKKNADERSDRAKAVAEERAASEEMAKNAEIATLDGEERIKAQRDKDVDELVAKQRKTNDAATAAAYARAIEARYKQADKELDIISERNRKEKAMDEQKYKDALDAAEKIADAVERAFTNAIQNTRNQAAGMFDNSGGSAGLIGQKLDAIARNTRSRL